MRRCAGALDPPKNRARSAEYVAASASFFLGVLLVSSASFASRPWFQPGGASCPLSFCRGGVVFRPLPGCSAARLAAAVSHAASGASALCCPHCGAVIGGGVAGLHAWAGGCWLSWRAPQDPAVVAFTFSGVCPVCGCLLLPP